MENNENLTSSEALGEAFGYFLSYVELAQKGELADFIRAQGFDVFLEHMILIITAFGKYADLLEQIPLEIVSQ